jgi:hypothetical protein
MKMSTQPKFNEVSVVDLDLAGALESLLEEASLTTECDDDAMDVMEQFLTWEEVTGLVMFDPIPILDPIELKSPPPLPTDD